MYEVEQSKIFVKSVRKAKRSGMDVGRSRHVIVELAAGHRLPPEYRDHKLTGNLKGFRECHVHADWCLVYEIHRDVLVLTLVDIGSHSELFR